MRQGSWISWGNVLNREPLDVKLAAWRGFIVSSDCFLSSPWHLRNFEFSPPAMNDSIDAVTLRLSPWRRCGNSFSSQSDGRLIDGRSFSDVAKAMTKQAKAGETPALLSRAPHADRHLKS